MGSYTGRVVVSPVSSSVTVSVYISVMGTVGLFTVVMVSSA